MIFQEDSKKISFRNRVKLSNYIKKNSYYGIGTASVSEIVKLNILQATLVSMKRAIQNLKKKPSYYLIDGIFAPEGIKNCKTIVSECQGEESKGQNPQLTSSEALRTKGAFFSRHGSHKLAEASWHQELLSHLLRWLK